MRISKLLSVGVSIALVVVSLIIFFNLRDIYDWYRLRNYTPPAAIEAMAEATTMTDYGQKLFYVNHPELNDKTTFRQNCSSHEASIVLGCYVSNQGIYIYDVTDSRLKGVEEVTAAHEMLHVGYERLGRSERERVDQLVADAFNKLDDQRIRETVEQYRANDASVVPNELHSILGTEVRNLPDELEKHYQKYFENRSKVVKLAERYESAFTEREEKIQTYDEKLKVLATEIDSQRQEIDGLNRELQETRRQLDINLQADKIDAYNALVNDYNADVRYYNQLVSDAQANIRRYNQLVKLRNELALEERELYKSLDSRTLPQE